MYSLRFDVRDIFKGNRLAFSLQRIWIQFLGFLFGYSWYLLFTYLAIIIAGHKFGDAWQIAGLLPCLATFGGGATSWAVFFIGVLMFIISHSIASTAVSRATYMLLKGNHFYTWRESYGFAFRKASSVIFTPLSIGIIALLFVIGGLIVGILGRIPVIGELGFSFFYLIWIFAGLILFYFVLVFVISLIVTPAVISSTDDDAFEGVFQSFSIVWNQPVRFVFYELITVFYAIFGAIIFAAVLKQGFLLTDSIFRFTMGEKYISLMKQGMHILSSWIAITIGWMEVVFGDLAGYFYFSREFIQLDISLILNISSYIFAIMILIVGMVVISYGLAAINTGNTLIVLLLRKLKDGYNLLERKDDEEEDEGEDIDEQIEEKLPDTGAVSSEEKESS